ncbi:MAG: aminotransferase class V-fold PLP-dependent enzyme [Nitrospinae bacterium]|nr:aminotransferase class V-fold PLP-dependent enzyme [Nitrospinota bacterium]
MRDFWEDIRREFPVVRRWIYFNHAGVAPVPARTAAAVQLFMDEALYNGACVYDRWMARVEGVRRQFAGIIGAYPGEIAFVKNTSHGLSIVANGLDWNKGDNIVTARGEFPANIYPWMALKDRGVELRTVMPRNGRVAVEDLAKAIDARTRLLTISSVEFGNGFRNDLESIGRLCKEKNILFCVDAIQSLGALPLDVRKCYIDFLSTDGHKWLLAPEGTGCFYCSMEKLDLLKPPLIGWNSVKNSRDYSHYNFTLRPDAQRFEEGSPSVMGISALGASLGLLQEIGLDKIEERVLFITDRIISGLEERGYAIRTPRGDGEKSGIVSFQSRKPATILQQLLAGKDVACAARDGALRVSPHFYNSEEEVNRFFGILDEVDVTAKANKRGEK